NWARYWFKLPVFDNHFELYFQDQAQQKWTELVRGLESKVHSNITVSEKSLRESLPDTSNKTARLAQYIIEVLGKSSSDKMDVIAMVIQGCLHKASENIIFNYDCIEMLWQNMELRVITEEDVIKHRNICLFLA